MDATRLAHWRQTLLTQGTLTLEVKVLPRSARTELVDLSPDGILKIKLQALPEKGKANAELRRYLADLFNVPKTAITLLTGETSPRKRIRIDRV